MSFKAVPNKLGLTIKIGTHRKHGNGAKGGGRQRGSGKKAIVTEGDKEPVIVTGATRKELFRILRAQFNIPPNVTINESGVTTL